MKPPSPERCRTKKSRCGHNEHDCQLYRHQLQTGSYLPQFAKLFLTEAVARDRRGKQEELIRGDLADREALAERQLDGHVTSWRDDPRARLDSELLWRRGLDLSNGSTRARASDDTRYRSATDGQTVPPVTYVTTDQELSPNRSDSV